MLERTRESCPAEQLITQTAPAIPASMEDFFSKQGLVPARDDERRKFARRYFRKPAIAHLTTSLPAFVRKQEQIVVYSADLSLSGVGFLSDRELYPGERIQLTIPQMGTKKVLIQRCIRLAERCFCSGAQFETPITAAQCRGL
jgi:hypothetical protein